MRKPHSATKIVLPIIAALVIAFATPAQDGAAMTVSRFQQLRFQITMLAMLAASPAVLSAETVSAIQGVGTVPQTRLAPVDLDVTPWRPFPVPNLQLERFLEKEGLQTTGAKLMWNGAHLVLATAGGLKPQLSGWLVNPADGSKSNAFTLVEKRLISGPLTANELLDLGVAPDDQGFEISFELYPRAVALKIAQFVLGTDSFQFAENPLGHSVDYLHYWKPEKSEFADRTSTILNAVNVGNSSVLLLVQVGDLVRGDDPVRHIQVSLLEPPKSVSSFPGAAFSALDSIELPSYEGHVSHSNLPHPLSWIPSNVAGVETVADKPVPFEKGIFVFARDAESESNFPLYQAIKLGGFYVHPSAEPTETALAGAILHEGVVEHSLFSIDAINSHASREWTLKGSPHLATDIAKRMFGAKSLYYVGIPVPSGDKAEGLNLLYIEDDGEGNPRHALDTSTAVAVSFTEDGTPTVLLIEVGNNQGLADGHRHVRITKLQPASGILAQQAAQR